MRTKTALAATAILAAVAVTASPAAAHCQRETTVLRTSLSPATLILSEQPANALAGECYARVNEPAKYETITEQVLVSPASERVEVTPARFETVSERVLVKPATTRIETIPARFDWVDQQVLVSSARTEWRHSDCSAAGAVANATGECACLVRIPAEFTTVRKQVMISPASTRGIAIPAQYQTVQKTVMTSAASERRIAIPAKYETITRQIKVSDGRTGWVRIGSENLNLNLAAPMCGLDSLSTLRLQRHLREAGYEPGVVDGVFSEATRNALTQYQLDHGLAVSCEVPIF